MTLPGGLTVRRIVRTREMYAVSCGWIFAIALSSPVCAQIYIDTPQTQLVVPEDAQPFTTVYAAGRVTFDDNLFRLPNGYANLSNGTGPIVRSDRITEESVGLDDQWVSDLQNAVLHLRANHNDYANNPYLNNYSETGDGIWNWSLTRQLTGEISANYSRGLINFENVRQFEKDLIASIDYFGSARYQFGPTWALLWEARRAETRHSLVVAKQEESRVDYGALGLEYANTADNTLELQYQYESGSFPYKLVTPAVIGSDFHQSVAMLLVQYEPSDITILDANAGYLQRTYADERLAQYAGVIWHAALKWQITANTQLAALVSRDLTSYTAEASEYFVDQGRAVSATWTPREKFALSATFARDTQSYIAGSNQVTTVAARHDTIQSEKLTASYTPRSWLALDAFVRFAKRQSTSPPYPYDDRTIYLEVRFLLDKPQ